MIDKSLSKIEMNSSEYNENIIIEILLLNQLEKSH